MALKTMIENLEKARKAYEAQLSSIGEEAQKEVAAHLAPNIPPGYVVEWTQYTPYFNDGEACEFGVNEPTLKKEDDTGRGEGIYLGESAVEKYGRGDVEKSYETKNWRTNKMETHTYVDHGIPAIDGYEKAQLIALDEAWSDLPEDLMEKAFGDHVKVRIGRDGQIDVSDYSHD